MAQAAEKIVPAPSSKVESFEAFYRLKGEFAELVERFKNGIALERCSWSEAYAQGRLSLVMYFKWPEKRLGGRKPIADCEPGGKAVAALVFKFCAEQMGLIGRRQNQAMLVDTIKLGKLPQPKLTSMVRLYLVNDERREVRDGVFYRSVMCGLQYYVVPRFAHRQGHPVNAGNCDHDVVERGSQVMNRISDNQRDAGWKLCNADDLDALCAGVEIILNGQSCEVRIQKGAVLFDKLVDVALGPLGF
jgi:hypothetical protein